MRPPAYLQLVSVPVPKGWRRAEFHVSWKPCGNCGAKIVALTDPCSFDHADKILAFSQDIQKQGYNIEDLKALKNYFESTEGVRK